MYDSSILRLASSYVSVSVQASGSAPPTERNPNHGVIVEGILTDSTLRHVYFDISWDEVAKYMLVAPEVTRRSADMINRYPDRFLFGSDVVAPKDSATSAWMSVVMLSPFQPSSTP